MAQNMRIRRWEIAGSGADDGWREHKRRKTIERREEKSDTRRTDGGTDCTNVERAGGSHKRRHR